jgi:hypothetical protein
MNGGKRAEVKIKRSESKRCGGQKAEYHLKKE